jgi:hypothetical protein
MSENENEGEDVVEPAAPEDDLERDEEQPGLDPWLSVPPES